MTALLLGMAVSVGAPALKNAPKDEAPILGDWLLVEWLQNGTKVAFGDGSGVEFLPAGRRVWRDAPGLADERGYKLYPKTTPAQVDLSRNDGGTMPFVYPSIFKVEGEKLILAIGSPGGTRPNSFDAAGATMLMTFTRVKKKD
jgi:uncharacterized protein (TIGR03067 family)